MFPLQLLEQGLGYIVSEVKRLGETSVAFPTIGCGQARYPPQEVAQCIVEAAKSQPDVQVEWSK